MNVRIYVLLRQHVSRSWILWTQLLAEQVRRISLCVPDIDLGVVNMLSPVTAIFSGRTQMQLAWPQRQCHLRDAFPLNNTKQCHMVPVDRRGHLEGIEGHAAKGRLRGRECMSWKPPGSHLVQDAGFRDEKFGARKAIPSPRSRSRSEDALPSSRLLTWWGSDNALCGLPHALRQEGTRHLQSAFHLPRPHSIPY